MGQKQDLILIDTNVFVIDLRYKRDVNYRTNRAFLSLAARRKTGFTTIVNLLEICGILSFNLNERQLTELWFYFQEKYKIRVVPAPDFESEFPVVKIGDIFEMLKRRTSLGDALMISIANKHLPFVSTMVSWDKSHFENLFHGTVSNPEEFLNT